MVQSCVEERAQLRFPSFVVNARRADGESEDVRGGGYRELMIEDEMEYLALPRRQTAQRGNQLPRRLLANQSAEIADDVGRGVIAEQRGERQRAAHEMPPGVFFRRPAAAPPE